MSFVTRTTAVDILNKSDKKNVLLNQRRNVHRLVFGRCLAVTENRENVYIILVMINLEPPIIVFCFHLQQNVGGLDEIGRAHV